MKFKPKPRLFGPGTSHDFSQPEPLPDKAKTRVLKLLDSGRLFRYQNVGDVAQWEGDFAFYIGSRYAVACNSGGCAIFLALKALGVKSGDSVLTGAHTLAPVPGAIVHCGAQAVFVDTDPNTLSLCLKDLERKIRMSSAKVLVVSYMRGRVPDIDRMMDIADRYGVKVVEDCAHTLGAKWRGKHVGTFGAVGCWSMQTNKAVNAGEGGILSTDREDVASYLTVATGTSFTSSYTHKTNTKRRTRPYRKLRSFRTQRSEPIH